MYKRSFFLLLFFLFFIKSAMAFEGENAQTINLGDLEIMVIKDADVSMDQKLLPELAKNPEYIPLFEKGPVDAVDQVFLIRDGKRNILIDAGWGAENRVRGQALDILQANGVKPEDISDILMTHMDFDHAGGLIQEDRALFPNASLWISRPEFEAWNSGTLEKRPQFAKDMAKKVFDLYKSHLRIFNFGEEILPGIVALDASGHTPGHTAYEIRSGNDKLLVAGDLIHIAPVQLPLPDQSTVYDIDMQKAAQSRRALLERAAKEQLVFSGMHFPMIGRVLKREDGGFMMAQPRR